MLLKMIYLEVKLPDIPGSLIELIRPISQYGGNIYGILHHHDKKINNMIPVDIWFELSEELIQVSLENIKKDLINKNIQINKISVGSKNKVLTFIITGHVFDTDITDTIKRLDSKNIKVLDLHAKFTEVDEISSVMMKVEFPDVMKKFELINEIEKICKEKNLFLIRS
jgi:ACT domain-containing protein